MVLRNLTMMFLIATVAIGLSISSSKAEGVHLLNGVILESGAMSPAEINNLEFSCNSGDSGLCGKIATGTLRGNDGQSTSFILGILEQSPDGTAKGFVGYGKIRAWDMVPNYQYFENATVEGNTLTYEDVDGDTNKYTCDNEADTISGGGRSNKYPSFKWEVIDTTVVTQAN